MAMANTTASCELSLMSEMLLDAKAPAGYPVGCPTVDLVALPDSEGRGALVIKRPPNLVVLKGHGAFQQGQGMADVVTATWLTDGQQVVVGWSDGSVRLIGLESLASSYQPLLCRAPSGSNITHVGCAVKLISTRTLRLPHETRRHGQSQLPQSWIKDNLHVDFEPILPKLSPFPASSAGGDELATLFTQRIVSELVSMDTSSAETQDSLSLTVVGTDDGKVQLVMYNSLVIGSFDCPVVTPRGTPRLLDHASSALVSTQLLLFADEAQAPDQVWIVPMDLPFLLPSNLNLSHLCQMLTNLTNLFRYLKQASLHLRVEWKHATELPNRFLQSAQATLQEGGSGPSDIVTALYHMAVTGHAHKQFRDWLVESVGERGHKRWDKAVDTALTNIRSLVHENLVPALERCSLLLSRLHAFTQAFSDNDDIDFAPAQVSKITDAIDALTLVGHALLQNCMQQLESFAAFSEWLRFHIDRLSSSGIAEDVSDKEAALDSASVINFVQHRLTASPLNAFFDDNTDQETAAARLQCQGVDRVFDVVDDELQKQAQGHQYCKALTNIHFVTDYATSTYTNLVDTIIQGKRRSVRFGSPIQLSVGHAISSIDLAICPTTQEGPAICAALTSKHVEDRVFFFRSNLDIVNGISSHQPLTACCINVDVGLVMDARFIDAKTLVVTCSDPDNRTAIVPVAHEQYWQACGPYSPGNPQAMAVGSMENFRVYRLPEEHNVKPIRVQTFCAAGYMPARICLLAGNGQTWKTFIMPQE